MEITGIVIALLPEVSGQGKNGIWRKQEFVIEVPGQYPKKVCVAIWGDKIDEAALQINDEVTAHIDIESREYNSRWFTEVKAWKIDKASQSLAPAQSSNTSARPLPHTSHTLDQDDPDELPF